MKRKLKVLGMLAALLVTGPGLFAQDTQTKTAFSLKESQDFAIENSYFTRSAMMDVTMAQQRVKEITGIGLPQITAKATYNHFLEIPTQVAPANSFNPAAPADEFVEFQFGTKNNMTAGVYLNQMIFDGSYIVGLKASKTYRELAYANKAKTDAEIKRDVVKAYGSALVSKLNYEYVAANEIKLKELVKDNEALLETGFIEVKDLDQVKLLLLNTQSLLIDTKNRYKISLDVLKFTMGKPIAEDIVLTSTLEDIQSPFLDRTGNLGAKLQLENHVDYRRAFVNMEYQGLNLSNEKYSYAPKLYGFLNYEGNSFGNTFNHFSSDGQWFPSSIIGVQLDIPIFTGMQRHQRVQQAQVGFEQSQLQLEQMEQNLYLELANKRNTYEASINKLENTEENLRLSERIRDQTRIKYKAGTTTSIELTQTENQYLQSQINYVLAMIDVINSKADLDYALGRL